METRFIEATQGPDGPNWGKFCVARFDAAEWERPSTVQPNYPLLPSCGWDASAGMIWVLDLQTGEGAYFKPGGWPHADLDKHAVWVCPMFEPFLEWLYGQDLADLRSLPGRVALPSAPFAFSGYRRPGPGRRVMASGFCPVCQRRIAGAGEQPGAPAHARQVP